MEKIPIEDLAGIAAVLAWSLSELWLDDCGPRKKAQHKTKVGHEVPTLYGEGGERWVKYVWKR